MVEFLKGLTFFILPLGLGGKRVEFFAGRVQHHGGRVLTDREPDSSIVPEVSHVLVEDSAAARETCESAWTRARDRVGRETFAGAKYLKLSWLSGCLSRSRLIETGPYEIEWMTEDGREEQEEDGGRGRADGEVARGKRRADVSGPAGGREEEMKRPKVENEMDIAVSLPSCSSQTDRPVRKNKKVVEELEKLAKAYALRNDTWRSHSYRKAVAAITLYDKEITTFQEARKLPGVGDKMALKIMEILESGKLAKVAEVLDDKTRVLEIFCNVWGVGPATAESWYSQGFRSLDDLREKAKLTRQQEVGLRLYDDLLERIPRDEVREIYDVVREALDQVRTGSGLTLELVGSYRRGKATCGDVDFMVVTHGSASSSGDVLLRLTNTLKNQGYLTDDLVHLETQADDESPPPHRKYFGIFKLRGESRRHRRIDFFVVPDTEYASALFHYTGSGLFNRTVRMAAAKRGMTLTEHGLYDRTVRKGSEVISRGQLIPTPTEEDIFKKLGMPYQSPQERDH